MTKYKYKLKLIKDNFSGFRVGETCYRIENSGGLHEPLKTDSNDVRVREQLLVYAQYRINEESRKNKGHALNKLELTLTVKI
ncbi:MAG: hypothetical protein AABX85_02040 [Nanoarchaeota archaeon]